MTTKEAYVLVKLGDGEPEWIAVMLNADKALDWACSAVPGGSYHILPLIEDEKMRDFIDSHGGSD